MFGVQTCEVSKDLINKLCKNKELPLKELNEHIIYRDYLNLLCADTGQSILANTHGGTKLVYMDTKDLAYQGWTPRDREQSCYFWSLKRKKATFCLGAAGTGKTSIAIAYGLRGIFKEGKPLILCKPTVFVGQKSNAIAAVPGDERDKLAPYMDSYLPSLKKILGRNTMNYIYEWEEKDLLSFRAIELIRGQHFENCTLIIDEAQNLTLHELISVLSRVGEGGRAIILGDPDQVDTGLPWSDTGLSKIIESNSNYDSELTSTIRLTKQYRGPLAALCQEILEEYRD